MPRALSVKAVDEDFVVTSVRDSWSWSAGEYIRNVPVSLFMLTLKKKQNKDIMLVFTTEDGWKMSFFSKDHIICIRLDDQTQTFATEMVN